MKEGAAQVADATRLPALVLLPGLDGTGKLFAEFVKLLDPGVCAMVVAYPPDQPLGYEELDALVRGILDKPRRDQRYVLLGESFSGPLAIRSASTGRSCRSHSQCIVREEPLPMVGVGAAAGRLPAGKVTAPMGARPVDVGVSVAGPRAIADGTCHVGCLCRRDPAAHRGLARGR
jgi:hypothetical protein